MGAASRIFWLVDHKNEINDGKKSIKGKFNSLEFKNVLFSYKNRKKIINNLNKKYEEASANLKIQYEQCYNNQLENLRLKEECNQLSIQLMEIII